MYKRIGRIIKILKERAKLLRFLDEWVELRQGLDRLLIIVGFVFLFVHILACLWYVVVDITRDDPDSWLVAFSFLEASNFDVLNKK